MGNEPINLAEKLSQFSEHWAPRTVAQLNDYDIMVVKVQGEFVWHAHAETDDFFLVLKGRLTIRLRDGEVVLGPGELFVVPRGVEHQPFAEEETHLLLIEPSGTPNTGDATTAAPHQTISATREPMNDELLALYNADREERIDQPRMGTPEYTAMRERDQQRRLRAAAILAMLPVPETVDLYHAALLFQHGDLVEDAWRAYELAHAAAGQGERRARWLTAAAYDRWLMYQSKPQKYGTQYVSDGVRQRLWDVDPTTTDAERAAWNVPPLAEQLRKAEEATCIDPPQPIKLDDAPWWLKEALLRWSMTRAHQQAERLRVHAWRLVV